MMRHAYLIMAYNDFYLLSRLLQVIDNLDADIYLHLDAGRTYSNIDLLKRSIRKSKCYISSKVQVSWGGRSQVECELFLMQQAYRENYDYYHLISGQDFLLKPVTEIQKFFAEHRGKEFLSVDNYPLNKGEAFDRIDQYHFIMKNRCFTGRLERITSSIQHSLGIHRLKNSSIKDNFAKGMNWASMTHQFVGCLLQSKQKILQVTHYALCADELYKQIIYNEHKDEFQLYRSIPSPEEDSRPRHELEALATMRRIDWSKGNPYTYRIEDYHDLISSPCLFARKFSSNVDKEIIDRLFQHVKKAEAY